MMHMNAHNVNAATAVPRSLTEAIVFLTRPLIMFYTPSEISIVQTVLQTTLTTAYLASREPRLLLTLSPSAQPPRPLLAACIAAGVQWADWIVVLGGKELDLLIEPSRAAIRFGGQDGATATVWQESKVYRPPQLRIQVPLPEEKPSRTSFRDTLNSAIARAQGRTKAQELLEVNDKEEADEIFALLSNVTGITPTPTRDHFQPEDLSPISSPDSSRPSSRSSNLSRFSFDSTSTASMTSLSSASSSGPTQKRAPKSVICSPSHVPTSEDGSDPESSEESVYVDKSKKTVQKYLYQGGVSTVLTGGVMLGSTKTTLSNLTTRNERPMFGKPHASVGRPRGGVSASSTWRRF